MLGFSTGWRVTVADGTQSDHMSAPMFLGTRHPYAENEGCS